MEILHCFIQKLLNRGEKCVANFKPLENSVRLVTIQSQKVDFGKLINAKMSKMG